MKRMILVDGNSLMYRAYYGMSQGGAIQTNSKGMYTGAVYSFARMIKIIAKQNYDNFLVAFDAGKKTIRHSWMESYKAGRPPMPDEFRFQIVYIKQFLDLYRIKRYEIELYEADDIIGLMSKKAEDEGYHVDIYSSDKDLLQLISDKTTVHLTKKGMTELEDYNPDTFFERYNIKYTQFIDLKALMGDKSDNLPGIPGIGEKKAVKYLNLYNDLDGIIAHMDEIKGADGIKIKENYNMAILCKKMATIIRDFPITITLEDTVKQEPNITALMEFYKELEFRSFLKEMDEKTSVSPTSYVSIESKDELNKILKENSSFIGETYDYNYHRCGLLLVGISNDLGTFIVKPELLADNNVFKEFIENEDIKKNVYNYKQLYVLFKRLYGYDFKGVDFDLLLATYILNSSINYQEFKYVSDYYGYEDVLYDETVYGKGAKKTMPSLENLNNHIAKKVVAIAKLKDEAITKLNSNNQYKLLEDIEIPLSRVLGNMEFSGMMIDNNELHKQKVTLEEKIKELSNQIIKYANHDFNISSPKQLGVVLFDELGIPYPKKKATSYSTDIEVLECIKDLHPIVKLVIDYRAKTKLYSTYIEGLEQQIFSDGKVHTIFQQTLTTTGRLSSVEPNLQNIPIRTEDGHLIRKMFIPENKENSLFSSDYSQIELRVLAHLANVKHLKEAIINGEDIHTKTAKLIFNKEEISPLDRRRAKAVNFGIVYGISAFGLATDLGITNKEASDFINRYYEVYPEIKEYMTKVVDDCKELGYVKTIENRIRYIPDINSKIYMQREFAKRMAMNAPIQGSAADIIKIAMIKLFRELENNNLKSKMIVTVHDEVVLEVVKGEEEAVSNLVKNCMENAYKLDVPLTVESSFGKDWYEVK